MTAHLGAFAAGDSVHKKFTTFRPSTGAAFTLAGAPAVSVYKDGSTTQSTAGVTLTVDFDSVTGLHHVVVDTSADGTFYSSGSHFELVLTAGTVDGVSVAGTVIASFSLGRASAVVNTVRKNVALTAYMFKMVDATDFATAETGVTVTATRSIDGGAFGACANSAAEVSNGWYKINLAAADLNGSVIVLRFTGTGCAPTEHVILTQPT